MNAFVMGGSFILWWCVILGVGIILLRSLLRFVRTQERIAAALESIAAKK
jgi:hypothetical protein